MAKIYKRGGMWYSDYYQGDRRIRRKLSPYKEKAQELADDLIGMRDSEKNGTPIKDISWFAFREKYMLHRKARMNPGTYANDMRSFDMVEKYGWPLLQLSQMTPEYLDDFWTRAKTHKDRPLSDRTISNYVLRIKTAMYQARRWGLAPLHEWKLVKCLADGKRTEYLSFPEFQKVLAASEGRFQRAAMLMGWGGLRRGEVLHLEWTDVDFKNHVINIRVKDEKSVGGVWAPKGSKPGKPKNREVDMTKTLEKYLKALPDRTGLVLGGAPINKDEFSKYFRELGKSLGIRLFPHKFRHTCGSYLASTGVPLKVIGELFGQKDVRSTDIYTHVMPRARRNAVDQMERGIGQL